MTSLLRENSIVVESVAQTNKSTTRGTEWLIKLRSWTWRCAAPSLQQEKMNMTMRHPCNKINWEVEHPSFISFILFYLPSLLVLKLVRWSNLAFPRYRYQSSRCHSLEAIERGAADSLQRPPRISRFVQTSHFNQSHHSKAIKVGSRKDNALGPGPTNSATFLNA